MKCFIVDDEAHALEVLARYVEKTPGLELAGTEENPLVALNIITEAKEVLDITFVDVDMPQLSGVELAELINTHTTVVFTTAYPDYAFQAFEKNAVDYLLKPISYERFLKAIHKVKERFAGKNIADDTKDGRDHFFVKSEIKGKIVRVDLAAIDYIEALQNYVRIHSGSDTLTTYLTMKEVEENLPENKFSRVHKSFIVNSAKVRALEGNQIILSNKSVIPLGANYRTTFMETIMPKLIKSKRQH